MMKPEPAKKKATGLGRGLSALLGEEQKSQDLASLDKMKQFKGVAIDLLEPNPLQPRHHFDEEALRDLTDSIKEKGVLQPLLVRRKPDNPDRFEIIAGERRFRAAQLAGLTEVPVLVRELDDQGALEVALIENLQRQDLSPLEEAEGYRRLMEEFSHTQEQLGQVVGKSRSHIANMLRLLSLPEEIKTKLESGELSAGHARALLNAQDPEGLAAKIISLGLSVRQAEKLVSEEKGKSPRQEKSATQGKQRAVPEAEHEKSPDEEALEKDLSGMLGIAVSITFKTKYSGVLSLTYENLEQLDTILRRLGTGGSLNGEGDENVPEAGEKKLPPALEKANIAGVSFSGVDEFIEAQGEPTPSAEEAPAPEEVPVVEELVPTEEVSPEETPVEEVSVEEVPAEETPNKEETPAAELSSVDEAAAIGFDNVMEEPLKAAEGAPAEEEIDWNIALDPSPEESAQPSENADVSGFDVIPEDLDKK